MYRQDHKRIGAIGGGTMLEYNGCNIGRMIVLTATDSQDCGGLYFYFNSSGGFSTTYDSV